MFKRTLNLVYILALFFIASCGDHDPINPHGFEETPNEPAPSSENVEVRPENPLDNLPETITRDQAESFLSDLNSIRSSSVDCSGVNAPAVGNLEWDNALYVAAYRHNQDMTQNNFFSDVGSDESSLNERINNVGAYFIFEQVISTDQANLEFTDTIEQWKLDRRNCFNIMGKAWNKVGISRSASHATVVLGSAKPNF